MGRIKTKLTKRVTLEMMQDHSDEFTEDFANNKKKVDQFLDIPSKKLRNIVAGYATRLAKKKED